MPVLKPEVENITQQVDGKCIMPDHLEPGDYFLFSGKAWLRIRRTEVKIRGEVDFFVGRKFEGVDHALNRKGREENYAKGAELEVIDYSFDSIFEEDYIKINYKPSSQPESFI